MSGVTAGYALKTMPLFARELLLRVTSTDSIRFLLNHFVAKTTGEMKINPFLGIAGVGKIYRQKRKNPVQ